MQKNPKKIITNKLDIKEQGPDLKEIEKIISIFKFNDDQILTARNLIKSLYKILTQKDASLIEINPLILTKDNKIVCLDAKMNFDDNAILEDPKF